MIVTITKYTEKSSYVSTTQLKRKIKPTVRCVNLMCSRYTEFIIFPMESRKIIQRRSVKLIKRIFLHRYLG
jgi:hypothetical protein